MKMPYLTVEEVEANFDFVMTLVERGQTFLIKSENCNCILAPYAEMRPKLQLQQELSSMLDEQLTELGQSATI